MQTNLLISFYGNLILSYMVPHRLIQSIFLVLALLSLILGTMSTLK